jgi:acyl carrier protein
MNPQQEIRNFIEKLLRKKGDLGPFDDAESLILGGRLESIDAVEIVMFLENRFGLNFAEIGFDQISIDSINLIHGLVRSHDSGETAKP